MPALKKEHKKDKIDPFSKQILRHQKPQLQAKKPWSISKYTRSNVLSQTEAREQLCFH